MGSSSKIMLQHITPWPSYIQNLRTGYSAMIKVYENDMLNCFYNIRNVEHCKRNRHPVLMALHTRFHKQPNHVTAVTEERTNKQTNSVALSPQANYTDWANATCRRNLVPTFVDRGVLRGQHGGSLTVVNLSFLDQNRYFYFK
jgi:hypothetical protein